MLVSPLKKSAFVGALLAVAACTPTGPTPIAPRVTAASFSVAENAETGTRVGTIGAVGFDGSSIQFAIIEGNTDGAFEIDSGSGQLTVARTEVLDFEADASFTLEVEVTDGASHTGTAAITVAVTDVNEAPTLDGHTFTMLKNTFTGASVGLVTVSDPDEGQTHVFAIKEGNDAGVFALDAATGAFTVADASLLDAETTGTFALTVTATDSGTPTLEAETTVTINIADANEAPVASGGPFSIAENAVEGTLVGMMSVSDPDAGQTHTFSVEGGPFAIDPATGALTVSNAPALDFETTPRFTLAVRVQDSGELPLEHVVEVVVDVTDVNERPVLVGGPFTLAENSAPDLEIGTLVIVDPELTQGHAVEFIAGNESGAFGLVGTTLVVADASRLDFETNASFTLMLRVVDDGTPPLDSTLDVVVSLTDVNEAPSLSGGPFTIAENSTAGTVIGELNAADEDTAQQLNFAFAEGQDTTGFSMNAATGVLTVSDASVLNFEARQTFQFDVTVTDNGTPALTTSHAVTLTVVDVNEAPTVAGAVFTVEENSAAATELGTVSASDPDSDDALTYALTVGNTGDAFTIDATGRVTVASSAALDFEKTPTFSLTVRVTDEDGLSDTATVTVNVADLNEAPVLSGGPFAIEENSAPGSVLGTVSAVDPDAGQSITFSLVDGNDGGTFALDPTTGEITVIADALLDFETVNGFTLTVRADDDAAPSLSDTVNVLVSLVDVDEAPALQDATFTLEENSATGTVVGQVSLSTPDVNDAHDVTLTAGNTDGAFEIDAAGKLTVANAAALDFETTSSFQLTVRATDVGGQSDTATVTVTLTDQNEAPTVTGGPFVVAMTAAAGDTVGTLEASDPERPAQTLSFAFAGNQTTSGYFGIESTGRLYVKSTEATFNGETRRLADDVGASYDLAVTVTDSGTPARSTSRAVSIAIQGGPAPESGTLQLNGNTGVTVTSNVDQAADLGSPRAQVVTFGGGDLVDQHSAGETVDLGDGTLTVAADGTVTLLTEAPGEFTFDIQVANASGAATITVQVALCALLEVGEVAHYSAGAGEGFCLASDAEYLLVPTNGFEATNPDAPTQGAVTLDVVASGILSGAPSPNVEPSTPVRLTPSRATSDGEAQVAHDFELDLRRQEHELVNAKLAALRAARRFGPNLNIVPGAPTVGDFMSLNTSSDACNVPDVRTARVEAVSTHAIVMNEWLPDESAPVIAGGFTPADFQEIADRFDNEIWPVITATFGEPQDIDANGRIVVLYTTAVNELTPPGSSSYVGGFVFARDLFPTTQCPTSNLGEMFYMLSPDPTGTVNGHVRETQFVKDTTFGTLAHEFQHLINASRRLYVNNAPELEVTWLNEGLSHIAEELMFYEAADLQPGVNVDLSAITSSQQRLDAFNTLAISNIGRLQMWLQAPHAHGPFSLNDELATRGAVWAFLRYAADRKGGDETAFWHALVNGPTTGLANLEAVFGEDPKWWASDFTQAMYLDDSGVATDVSYTQPSWNFRSVYTGLGDGTFPLPVRALDNNVSETFTLASGGAAAYLHLTTSELAPGQLTVLSGGSAAPATVELSLIRLQ